MTTTPNPWLILGCAIILEVAGTTFLKLSDGFRNVGASAIMAVFYAASFFCVSIVIRQLSMGMAYAIWAGVGTVLIALVGHTILGDRLTPTQGIFILMVAIGVAGLKLSAPSS
ncbi:MAG: multidrug efflux SMR transporter [Myxococcales bacterium]|nr:multidrug efflux SMR transporter [Myxococcales bacterium]